jgi:cytochrome c-type biogenesis protein
VRELLMGGTLLASLLGGVVALLAPCCVSVMLPAYLATGLGRRRGVLAATFVFAAGVATVIVPIGLGAGAISAAISGHHLLVYSIGGAAMVAGGVAMIAGWAPRLPMPARSGRPRNGLVGAYGLGAFSGIASACCAPVLAGVAVLSGATGSFTAALAVSVTYVVGMVAPLLVLALAWDRRKDRAQRLLRGRDVRLRVGRWRRTLPLGRLLSGLVLVAMGAVTVGLAITGPSMPNSGWRVTFIADLQHVTAVIARVLSWVPGWAVAVLLVGGLALLVLQARRTTDARGDQRPGPQRLDPGHHPPPSASDPLSETPVAVEATRDEQ